MSSIRIVRRTALATLLLVALGAREAATQVAEPEPHATLNGVVVDARTGVRVPGASVILIQQAAPVFSDEEGRFAFREVRPGTQTLIVTQIGYDSLRTEVEFRSPDEPVTVALEADPVVLERIEILVDRLASRWRSIGWSVRVFDQMDLQDASAFSVLDLITQRSGLRRAPCYRPFAMTPCAYVRGRVVPVRVVVDGAPMLSGLDLLETLPPEELYTVEVYAGGREIHAYTTWFVKSVARGRPLPPDPFL